MSGVVGVIARDDARFSMFGVSLTGLQLPEGSYVGWQIGEPIAGNCNRLVRTVLERDHEWLWLMGDDHAFEPNLLHRLLERDVDIVVPLCLKRWPPFEPVIFSELAGGLRRCVDLDDYPDGGLIEVHSAGSGGMLIRRRVFEQLDDPWFETGRVRSDELAEDLYFCDKARAAGFKIHADLDCLLGHITPAIVWPRQTPEGWTFGFGFPEGVVVTIPPSRWSRDVPLMSNADTGRNERG